MKVALIGYGYWGKIVKKYIDENENVQLKRIYDRNRNLNQLFTDNLIDIANDNEIECVMICTPIHTHYNLCKLFLENGKHVFCEKPLATISNQVEELIETAVRNKKVLYTDYIYTLSKGINQVRAIRSRIGKLLAIEARIEQFGAFYKEEHVYEVLGVHLISAVIHILDCYNSRISVKYTDVLNNSGYCLVGKIHLDIDDIPVNIHCDLLSINKHRTIKIVGSEGIIQFDMLTSPTVALSKIKQVGHKFELQETFTWDFDELNNLKTVIDEFVDYIRNTNVQSNCALSSLVTRIIDRTQDSSVMM